VKLKEAPALGKTIFHHAPNSAGAQDYLALAEEVESRIQYAAAELAANAHQTQMHLLAGGVQ